MRDFFAFVATERSSVGRIVEAIGMTCRRIGATCVTP
jgi:hypothetical protein